MLLEFTVGNTLSFYANKTLSLQAQSLKDIEENVAHVSSYRILKSLALYGANSSGKSNLINSLAIMRHTVLSSVQLNPNDSLYFDPFLLFKNNNKPCFFEIVFLLDEQLYRYGFSYTEKKIIDEWLFCRKTKRSKEQTLFLRNEKGIAYSDETFPEAIGLETKTNDNRLFLSLCAQLGGYVSNQIVSWFDRNLNVISGLENQDYRAFSKEQFHEKKEISLKALGFFKTLQLGFNEISTHEEDMTIPSNLPKELVPIVNKKIVGKKKIQVESVHNLYNNKGICGTINFSFDENESSGTRKLFDLSGPIFDTLRIGSVLVVDELDAKMHPLISQQIINLFNNSETNPNNAQLIFTTHDTHLLSTKKIRRDQIWFTEKNDKEQTDLYCLTDIILPDGTKVRNDANYEKNYIAGRYGAIPYIVNE